MQFTQYYRWLWLCFGLTSVVLQHTQGVPVEYDSTFDGITSSSSSELYDLDAEQSQARYDPRVLSKELIGSHAPESHEDEYGAHCINANERYEHGQKISRTDPCEICLCVDGEVFCWWKKCGPDPLEKKPPKKQKPMKNTHHGHNGKNNNHHHQQHGAKQKLHRKSSAKNIIPKNVLKFPQHLPVHILDLDVNEMDDDDEEGPQTQATDSTSVASTTTTTSTTQMTTSAAINELSSSPSETPVSTTAIGDAKTVSTMAAIIPPAVDIPSQLVDGIVLDDRATSVPVVFGSSGDLSIQTPESNNTVKPVILMDDKESIIDASTAGRADDELDGGSAAEKNYYEKTIVNKNGVFIENIRKITNIDQRILGGSAERKDNESARGSESPSETISRKSIELMNAPVARSQHYVITSSGQIEKTDTPANDDLGQFGNSLLANNIKNFNMNKDYNRGQEEEEQQQEQNSNSYSSDYSVTTNDAAAGVVTGDAAAAVSPSAVPTAVTTNSTPAATNNNCIVMGVPYKIGTVLPQETGNCLQCTCVTGANEGDPPRVTCSPHNCPPLILPDLFDASGY